MTTAFPRWSEHLRLGQSLIDMPRTDRLIHRDQGQAGTNARDKLKKLTIQAARETLRLGVAVAVLGGGAYLLVQSGRQQPALASTPTPAPTVGPTPIVRITPTSTASPASTLEPTPTALASAPPASTPRDEDAFEDGIKRVLRAASSGFLELRGTLTKTEDAATSGTYALFRQRKIYEGKFVFGGANSAQLEEVYYNRKPDQPAYNYRLYFQRSSDGAPTYDRLRQRLDVILTGFVHTSGTGYDAWAGSDARGTAVLLSDREVGGFVEIQVHVTFPTPRW
jgi:hypothetical protein